MRDHEPIPDELKRRRHAALLAALRKAFKDLLASMEHPEWFDETAAMWPSTFFRTARCDPLGLRVRCRLEFSAASDSYGMPLNDGALATVVVDHEVFDGTGLTCYERDDLQRSQPNAGSLLDAVEADIGERLRRRRDDG